MKALRRLLAHALCVALAVPPAALAQAAPPAAAAAPVAGLKGVALKATEADDHARLQITWPAGAQGEATAALADGMGIIRLPVAVDVDPSVFAAGAPGFVAAAALSRDKRSIRLALLRDARLVTSRDGASQAFDLVAGDAPPPPPLGAESPETASAPAATKAGQAPAAKDAPAGPPPKLRNAPVPAGAPRVIVTAAAGREFTRFTISGPNLPAHDTFRRGDRLAIGMKAPLAFDLGSLRASPPARVKDLARWSDGKESALVMDVEPGAVLRTRRQDGRILVDILPPGSNPDALEALAAEAAKAAPAAAAPAAPQAKAAAPEKPAPEGPTPAPGDLASAEPVVARRADPAPSGVVTVIARQKGGDLDLEFEFAEAAPAAMFRHGAALYALFPTTARFDVSKVASGRFLSRITPIVGEGVSGVRIEAPPEVQANPGAVGTKWVLSLSPRKAPAGRLIAIDREKAADGTARVRAVVPDAAAHGRFVDSGVGDVVLVGMALGPPSALPTRRSYLEASLPETLHGLVVAPRADDLELRQSPDGFVLVRPSGMALSRIDDAAQATGFAATAPGLIDFNAWRRGPAADHMRTLDALRRAAAIEAGGEDGAARARMDLARFLLAWELAPEAHAILRNLKAELPALQRAPEVLGLEGAALTMMLRNRQALNTLSQPEIVSDPASQLWAGLAAAQSGDPAEARRRFERGREALSAFAPEQRARFRIADGKSALDLGDPTLAARQSEAAQGEATDPRTRMLATLLRAQAMGAAGKIDQALEMLAKLEGAPDRQVAAHAAFERAILADTHGKSPVADTVRALDALRYAWRGDELELKVLRRLGALYVQAGDIRSGLSTLASASTLRPDLPEARALREDLATHFRKLFLEGGADGMDPVQALALFYDFRDLTPVGPEGDRMVRGLVDRLVALDLLPQATELLQHQVDKRLEGFAKAQVATDLAAIYLLDRQAEKALQAIWNSRVALLPEPLNAQRRLIEAAGLAELGRKDHALEVIEFDSSPDASRIRAEVHWRAGDWARAGEAARATLPPAGAPLDPGAAGEVLRAAVAATLASDAAGVRALSAAHGAAMARSAFAEAFKVAVDDDVPDTARLQAAVATVSGASPFNALVKRLRTRTYAIENDGAGAAPDGPTDGDPGQARVVAGPVAPPVAPAAPAAKAAAPRQAAARPAPKAPDRAKAAPAPRRVAQATPARPPAKTDRAPARTGVQAPRDPPPTPVVAR
jgi:tetratricopeptide (TPR) repeat protein